MMKLTLLTLVCAAVLAGVAWSQDKDADNTGRNVRDRDDQSQTATDQSNDPADIKMTADIRKMVVNDGSLSMTAKNVKIITVDGKVTLRGPIQTEKEKAAIESHAKQAGAKSITNELEVEKS
jgi:hyperosmotically inducible periplasmic protein